ncbi:MAG: hypothetical protein OXD33_07950, partial [Rhodobacteraceae bacterium]|nr:hypothetical protein [Paracoccaceae bacterium]
MIPKTNITAWSLIAPWAEPRQIEQDLIISLALVAIFNHDLLRTELKFRRGTALNKSKKVTAHPHDSVLMPGRPQAR